MQPKKVKVTDFMLGRILELRDRLIMCELELDDIYKCHAEFEEIRSVWQEYKHAVVDAKKNINMYIKALRREPAMDEIISMLERCIEKSKRLVDDDPLTAIQSEYIAEIDSIINHGKKPWVARLNRAEFVCNEWEAYMRTPEVQHMYNQYIRIKPLDDNRNRKKHVLSDEEQMWADYMSMSNK